MKIKKTVSLIAAAVLASGLAVIGTDTPALAATCGSTSICFFDNSNGTGLLETDSTSIRVKSICYTVASLVNNKTSYIVNGSASYWYVFDNGSCSSTPGTIYPHSQGAMNSDFNNNITSYYRAT